MALECNSCGRESNVLVHVRRFLEEDERHVGMLGTTTDYYSEEWWCQECVAEAH